MRWIASRKPIPCRAKTDEPYRHDGYDLDVTVTGPADSDSTPWRDDVTVNLYLDGEGADDEPDAEHDGAQIEVRLADLLDAVGVPHQAIPEIVDGTINQAQNNQARAGTP